MKKVVLILSILLFGTTCFAEDYGRCLRVFYKKADKTIVWTHEIINIKGDQPGFATGSEKNQLNALPAIKPDGIVPLGGNPEDYGYYDITDTQTVNNYHNSKAKYIDVENKLCIELYTQTEIDSMEMQRKIKREEETKNLKALQNAATVKLKNLGLTDAEIGVLLKK